MSIQLIQRKDLDDTKWNRLVEEQCKGLPYAYTWYLDAVCDRWMAFVEDDYCSAYPFQIKKKYGLSYSLLPFLVQQLGYIGKHPEMEQLILKKLKSKVWYLQHHLFYFNTTHQTTKTNLELNLNHSYQNIYKNYNSNTKRNLKKVDNNQVEIHISDTALQKDIDFIIQNTKLSLNETRIRQLKQLLINAEKNKALEIYQATFKDELLGLVVFIRTQKRAVYLMAVSNEKGLNLRANFKLVDSFINKNAERNMVLDFEGSSIEGIARFYKGFGAIENNYQLYKAFSFKIL